jgi:Ca2+-binding RTX toxin-like protein
VYNSRATSQREAAMAIQGTAGNDDLTGTSQGDTFYLDQGGNDVVEGLGGDDVFEMGGAFVATDRLNGGTGRDTLSLDGDYSAGIVFVADTIRNFEAITLAAGYDYSLTTNDASVAAGRLLAVEGSALGAADTLVFDGSAETDGRFKLIGGAGDDTLTGGSGADIFDLEKGGDDTAQGGGGNDVFDMRAALDAGDRIDGGAGTDTVVLDGNYFNRHALTLAAGTIANVEEIRLEGNYSYNLTTNDANLAAGQVLLVNADILGDGGVLTFDGWAETDGSFKLVGGIGDDTLTGGSGNDLFVLRLGGDDVAHGGGGNDMFEMGATMTAADIIDGGAGSDTVELYGDYTGSRALALTATTMVNVEQMRLETGYSYDLTTTDANVAAGQVLTIDAASLGAADTLVFDGTAESDGSFIVIGGAGDDVITGGAGNDVIELQKGGDDTVNGGAGNDLIEMGGALTLGDHINGGANPINSNVFSYNVLALDGNYAGGLRLDDDTLANIDEITFGAGHSYVLNAAKDELIGAFGKLTLDASALGAGDKLVFNAVHLMDVPLTVYGGFGPVEIIGNQLGYEYADTIYVQNASAVTLTLYPNDYPNDPLDKVVFGANFGSTDSIDFTYGSGDVELNGDYSAGLTITSAMLQNCADLILDGGHSYNITMGDVPALALTRMNVGIASPQPGDTLVFNGAAETLGDFNITDDAGNDVLTGGQGGDIFRLENGGTDIVHGGSGNDEIICSGNVAQAMAADTIDGGAGGNTLEIAGTGSVAFNLGSNVSNIANLSFVTNIFPFASYDVTTSDAAVAAGATLIVGIGSYGTTLTFDGSAETDGHFNFEPGDYQATLTGGALSDTFQLGNNTDTVTGGGGGDLMLLEAGTYTLVYDAVSDSTGPNYDTVSGLNFSHVTFDVSSVGSLPAAIDAAVAAGSLSTATFDADLAAAIGAGQLAAHHAVLFTANAGTLAGQSFLIVDENGQAGYQAEADLVIAVTGFSGTISTANFG